MCGCSMCMCMSVCVCVGMCVVLYVYLAHIGNVFWYPYWSHVIGGGGEEMRDG